ncbi:type II restriction enzyme [Paenibacillus sp. y28]|uniref:type II restriction enzyme n=1 Tax=Paenibacillus sp. y28 TaxID=3129110 RepID=UPI0030198EF8
MNLTDQAWNTLFERHGILEEIEQHGSYVIQAKTIKEVREPRLMAKFDHSSNLPELFTKQGLSILPLTRSSYILGDFDVYAKVKYSAKVKPKPMSLPKHITTLDPANLYSESSALHCAMVSGMIDDILGEPAVQTISGRMSSKQFDFTIRTKKGIDQHVSIKNAQVEIDGGYESESRFMIVEAKKEAVEDFLVRQLYYPYRLWQEQTSKEVIPVFFTHSNDIFSFFVYRFTDPMQYNSLELVEQRDYVIAHEKIELADITSLLTAVQPEAEPEIPFPQADSFPRIVDLLGLLYEADITKEHFTLNYDFDSRQTNYYTSAAMYLGLVERYADAASKQVKFRLSAHGARLMRLPLKQKYLSLASCIVAHAPFRLVLQEQLESGAAPDKQRIVDIMKSCDLYQVESESTYVRRSSTIRRWVDWLLKLPEIY